MGQLQSIMQTVGTIGTLLENYDGMMLGAKFSRAESAATVNTNATTTAAATTTNTTNSTATANTTNSNETSTGSKVLNGLSNLFKKK